MKIAHLKNNIVTNISIGQSADGVTTINVDGMWCDIGATYSNGTFTPRPITMEDIIEQRRASYPPLSELADALYWQNHGDSSKMDAYLAQCESVKIQYPKPS